MSPRPGALRSLQYARIDPAISRLRDFAYQSDELVDEKLELFTVDSRIFGDGFEEGTTAAWPDLP